LSFHFISVVFSSPTLKKQKRSWYPGQNFVIEIQKRKIQEHTDQFKELYELGPRRLPIAYFEDRSHQPGQRAAGAPRSLTRLQIGIRLESLILQKWWSWPKKKECAGASVATGPSLRIEKFYQRVARSGSKNQLSINPVQNRKPAGAVHVSIPRIPNFRRRSRWPIAWLKTRGTKSGRPVGAPNAKKAADWLSTKCGGRHRRNWKIRKSSCRIMRGRNDWFFWETDQGSSQNVVKRTGVHAVGK